MGKLAIIAGGGELPHVGMSEAIAAGEDVIFLGLKESDFSPRGYESRTIPVHITQVGKILKTIEKQNVDRVLMLGKVRKDLLFQGLKFDLKALSILAKTINRNDYPIFLAIADEFKRMGVTVISQKKYLKSLLLKEGRYTPKKFSSSDIKDIEFGMMYAEKMADLDIGQLVVVCDESVIAVEAVEGTDVTIRRGGEYTKKKGSAVVCKSAKSKQDERFDLPTVGVHTLQIMKESGCKTLCIREGETLVVDPEEVVDYATKSKLNFVVYGPSKTKGINGSQKKIKPL
ncbi:LpxI family protein [Leptospira ilyithenensis]|uniref:LpxI family protein n=1 Tax=Leptospira ilyithenensis TaxID=2484901 RepID=A0A4V3JWV5_9LEPT|nr:UDP-2,3-diacylglucosamine diphosphatase LpxI [Leptospira ilyithenensis]TGN07928.1 LpxI family protein [Leptospira ilyithenensis]